MNCRRSIIHWICVCICCVFEPAYGQPLTSIIAEQHIDSTRRTALLPCGIKLGWTQHVLVNSSWGDDIKIWGKHIELMAAVCSKHRWTPSAKITITSATPYRYGLTLTSKGESLAVGDEDIIEWANAAYDNVHENNRLGMTLKASNSSDRLLRMYNLFSMSPPARLFGSLFYFDNHVVIYGGVNITGEMIVGTGQRTIFLLYAVCDVEKVTTGCWGDLGAGALTFQVKDGNVGSSYDLLMEDVLDNQTPDTSLKAKYNVSATKSVFLDFTRILCGGSMQMVFVQDDTIQHIASVELKMPIKNRLLYHVRPDVMVGMDTSRNYTYSISEFLTLEVDINYEFGCLFKKKGLVGFGFTVKKKVLSSTIDTQQASRAASQVGVESSTEGLATLKAYMLNKGYIVGALLSVVSYMHFMLEF